MINAASTSPEIQSQEEAVGQRAWSLLEARKLEGQLGFSTSNWVVVPQPILREWGIDAASFEAEAAIREVEQTEGLGFRAPLGRLVDHFAMQLAGHVEELRTFTQTLGGQALVVRSSSLDEAGRPELSFAGSYKGYMPGEGTTRDEDLVRGTATMLAGRFTKYGNCYYERHKIEGERRSAAIYMEPFFDLSSDTPVAYGTAYVAGDHIRNEYYLTPSPDQRMRGARLLVERAGSRWYDVEDHSLEDNIDFAARMRTALSGLQDHFKTPLDVEYVVDPKGDLYILQVRRLSERHLANWRQLPFIDEASTAHRSALINTVGSVEGRVIDVRDFASSAQIGELRTGIVVVRQEPNSDGVDAQTLFELARSEGLTGLSVVMDRGDAPLRDHLPYALGEDPGIDFYVQTSDPKLRQSLHDGSEVRLVSNGISARLEQ